MAPADPTIKLVIVGNGSVGKSSIIARFTNDGFEKVYAQTVGVDFFERKIVLRGGASRAAFALDACGRAPLLGPRVRPRERPRALDASAPHEPPTPKTARCAYSCGTLAGSRSAPRC